MDRGLLWENWRFRRTLAYWITMMYLEGSILFAVGGIFAFFPVYFGPVAAKLAALSASLVSAPYLIGSVAFTLGSWAGVEELFRIPRLRGSQRPIVFCCTRPEVWHMVRSATPWEARVAYASYFVGALLFNVACTAAYFARSERDTESWVWLPQVLGSLGFTIGGAVECRRNRVWSALRGGRQGGVCSTPVWISVCNFLGGGCFLVAASSGALILLGGEACEECEHWLVDGVYLLGSILFLFGALIALWMWKCEQFGLGLMPELNEHDIESLSVIYDRNKRVDDLAQYGCGRSSMSQLPWLILYILNATASVIDTALALQPLRWSQPGSTSRITTALLNFLLSHGVLFLASVVHHIPTAAPHNWLLRYMRAVLLLYTINAWANVGGELDTLLRQMPNVEMSA